MKDEQGARLCDNATDEEREEVQRGIERCSNRLPTRPTIVDSMLCVMGRESDDARIQ